MLKILFKRLEEHGLSVELCSADIIKVQHCQKNEEADVSLRQLMKRLEGVHPEERQRIVHAFAGRIASAFGYTQALALIDIFPRILPFHQDKSLSAPWTFPIANGALLGTLVQDLGVNLRLLPPLELHRLGLSFDIIKDRALENLKLASQSVLFEPWDHGLRAQSGDGLMAARSLILGEWFEGPIWVGMPSRDELLVLKDPPTTSFSRLEEKYQKSPYPISSQFWLWTLEEGLSLWAPS